MGVDLAQKMLGQRTAEGLRRRRTLPERSSLRFSDGAGGLQVFELELICSIWRKTFSLFLPKSICLSLATSRTKRWISVARELSVAV